MFYQSTGVMDVKSVVDSDVVSYPDGGFGIRQSGLPPAPAFDAPLQTSLILRAGSGNPAFVRATTAYVADWEGLLKPVISHEARFTGARRVRNLGPNSADITGAGWSTLGTCTIVDANSFTLGASGANALKRGTGTGSVIAGAKTIVVSFTASGNGDFVVTANDAVAWNTYNENPLVTLTSSNRRYSVTLTSTPASTGTQVLLHIGRVTASGGQTGSTTGTAFDITDMQIEDVTGQTNQNPSEYVSVGVLSAPFHGCGVDGVKCFRYQNGNTVASNVVTEAAGAAIADSTLKGYLAEGARTNRCLQSQEFDDAVWVSGGGGIAVDDQSTAAPNGTTTADTLTASGANGTLIQDLGVVASADKTFSIWLKRKTGAGNIDLTLDGGSTWTTKTITASWARYEITQTLADEDAGIRIVTSGDEVYAWGAQVETAPFASSYIPTVAAAVTRDADVLTYANAGNVSNTAGTICANFIAPSFAVSPTIVGDSASNRALAYSSSGGAPCFYDGTNVPTSPTGLAVNTAAYAQVRWSSAGIAVFLNGSNKETSAYDGSWLGTAIGIGTGSGAIELYGNIRNVRIWTTALSDQQIAALGIS